MQCIRNCHVFELFWSCRINFAGDCGLKLNVNKIVKIMKPANAVVSATVIFVIYLV